MAEKNSDIFDKIEEEYKSRCARLDSDNLYLFGNQVSLGPRDDLCSDSTLYEGDVLNIDIVDEDRVYFKEDGIDYAIYFNRMERGMEQYIIHSSYDNPLDGNDV